MYQPLWAQDIAPKGVFLTDSIMIGEEISYTLSVKYPKGWQIVFPDSTYDYAPFEFNRKTYISTVSDSTWAFDSVTYVLSSFEIDPIQQLQLPIYVLQKNDSIEILSDPDSVYFHDMITQLPDSIVLKNNVAFRELVYSYNYLYIGIGTAVTLLILVGGYFLFRKTIHAKYQLYFLQRDYRRFVQQYEADMQRIQNGKDNTAAIEGLVLSWKTFMERMENRPFTKYTTREIIAAGYGGEELNGTLRKIDQSIYGKVAIEDMHQNLSALSQFTSNQFEIKKQEIKKQETNNG
ncbi:hypothetical protein [Reichenbachiella agariperforans]|uniref:hypothetical protein n=1 Tax=Reichenbachiella agariperforans TaxID=156994 RepID=UPI001C0A007A|nr:hypothetical protein [Reichenbachiella agariperforans]MBU2914600.1 hypothetical protein [Reichenbachiella agariperforans]